MPTNPNAKAAKLQRIRSEKDAPVRDRTGRALAAIFDGMVEFDVPFPVKRPGGAVRGEIIDYLAALESAHLASVTEKEVVRRMREAEKDAAVALSTLHRLVNGNYPHTEPERASFFPTGPGNHPPAAFVSAMIAGMKQHPLPGFAESGLEMANLEALVKRLGATKSVRMSKGEVRTAVSTDRANQRAKARELFKQLHQLVLAVMGRSDVRLASFGLKPRSSAKIRHRAAKKPADPVPPAASAAANAKKEPPKA